LLQGSNLQTIHNQISLFSHVNLHFRNYNCKNWIKIFSLKEAPIMLIFYQIDFKVITLSQFDRIKWHKICLLHSDSNFIGAGVSFPLQKVAHTPESRHLPPRVSAFFLN
jgi:hypothetical protein